MKIRITSLGGRFARPLTVAALLASVLLAVHAIAWLLPGVFGPLRARAVDHLFVLRTAIGMDPRYDDTVVLVSMDDRGLRTESDHYLDRLRHARLVQALARAGVAAQLHDMIFAAPVEGQADAALAQATAEAGNAYYGMALGPLTCGGDGAPDTDAEGDPLLARQRWAPRLRGPAAGLPASASHFVTFPLLATAARGIGFLDSAPDSDGVHRRAPLLVRDGAGFLPSISLRVISDYLGVPPEQIDVAPGRAITLRGTRHPVSGVVQDIAIPIDPCGRMIVNYIGEWDRLRNYPFSAIDEAAGDRFAMDDLREEMSGRIAVVFWLTTGSADLGPVPMDPAYPMSGVHATVLHNILTRDFLRELSGWEMLVWFELPLLALLLIAALRFSTIPFLGLASALLLAHVAAGALAFIGPGLLIDLPLPILFLVGSTLVVSGYQYNVQSQARARLERELAVAREIQMRTIPSTMPQLPGYEVAGISRPADETGGDTFDLIQLAGRRLVLLLGDATGHGLGPALSVTQVRAMLRIALRLGADLDSAFSNINDQLVEDLSDNKFVTAFLGVLELETHRVLFHSGGQGPLLVYRAATGNCESLKSTAMPMGMLSGIPLKKAACLELAPGDILALMTDGVFEYENPSSEQFGTERVAALLREHHARPMARLVEILLGAVDGFARSVPQADDMTILLLRRSLEQGDR